MGVIEGMAELGLLGIVIPEEYGGAGLDFVAEALVCEEIERGESAFRTLISVHVGLNSLSLLRYGTEEQKQRWLVAAGARREARLLRPHRAGGGLRRRCDAHDGAPRGRRLRPQRPEELDLVRDRRRPRARVREDRPGGGAQGHLRLRRREGHARASRPPTSSTSSASGPARPASSSSRTSRCPAENLIGEEGQGFEIAMYSLDQGRFTVAAGALGVIRACLERSVEYARERETFGQAIGTLPVRAGHDRRDGARLRDVEAARHAGRVAQEQGRAQHARDRRSPSGTRPRRRSRPRTSRSRSTARTATRPSTASSGTSGTRGRRSSTRARRRSTR